MDEYQNIKNILRPNRPIVASAELKRRVAEAKAKKHGKQLRHRWLWYGASTAACAAILLGIGVNRATGESDCVVYVSGKMVDNDKALSIAEADVARMEQFRQTVEKQKAEEEAKVQRFMSHKTERK